MNFILKPLELASYICDDKAGVAPAVAFAGSHSNCLMVGSSNRGMCFCSRSDFSTDNRVAIVWLGGVRFGGCPVVVVILCLDRREAATVLCCFFRVRFGVIFGLSFQCMIWSV